MFLFFYCSALFSFFICVRATSGHVEPEPTLASDPGAFLTSNFLSDLEISKLYSDRGTTLLKENLKKMRSLPSSSPSIPTLEYSSSFALEAKNQRTNRESEWIMEFRKRFRNKKSWEFFLHFTFVYLFEKLFLASRKRWWFRMPQSWSWAWLPPGVRSLPPAPGR